MDTIEGTWRLVRAMARDDAGNPRPPPYEGHGMGCIVIGGGRLAVMMIDWRHDVPGDQKREYSGYTGTCTYVGKQLITTVDAAQARVREPWSIRAPHVVTVVGQRPIWWSAKRAANNKKR